MNREVTKGETVKFTNDPIFKGLCAEITEISKSEEYLHVTVNFCKFSAYNKLVDPTAIHFINERELRLCVKDNNFPFVKMETEPSIREALKIVFEKEIYPKIKEIKNNYNNRDWFSFSFGWAISKDVSIEDARLFAVDEYYSLKGMVENEPV